MKKSRLILAVLGALLLGMLVGGGGVWLLLSRFTNKFMGSSTAASAVQEIEALQFIRTGDTNHAIELLEIHLDGDIVMLGNLWGDVSPNHRDPTCMGVLKHVRDYRVKYPHQSLSPEGDALIAKTFELVDADHPR